MQIKFLKIYSIIFSMILFFFSIQSCKNESIDQNYADNDSDGFYDMIDNCPFVPNPDQIDSNSDGIGDFCSDMDDDGIIDIEDNCPKIIILTNLMVMVMELVINVILLILHHCLVLMV